MCFLACNDCTKRIGIPVFELADVAKSGYGGMAKGYYGFGYNPQQVTLDVIYSSFPIKDLPPGFESNYSSFAILTGYRYLCGGVFLELQAGVGFNHIKVESSTAAIDRDKTSFYWTFGLGYQLKGFELGAAYHNTGLDDPDEDIPFIRIYLGYNFKLGGK